MEKERTFDDVEKLDISFTNGALTIIKDLAEYFSVPPTELKTILVKGLQVLSEVKKSGNKYVIIEDISEKRERIDINSI